ncbi:hypothetical protein [Nonomuraea rhizosphaerae]|uniref:hypothetical protein n=1 Tax=Nonomuraea rhizosphaerae TaxID=2665663 RepID=UPI001C5E279B|nr:hypothetical protein [Nonomuraea rhizosphaerae]
MAQLEGMVPDGVRSLNDTLRQAETSLDSIGEELWALLSRAWLLPSSADIIRQVAAWAGDQGPEINKRLLLLERMELAKPELFGAGKPPISVDDSLFVPGAVLPLAGNVWDRIGQQIQATLDPSLNSGDPLTEQVKGAVEGVAGLGKLVVDVSPNRMIIDHMGWQRSLSDLSRALVAGAKNPGEFAKSVLDWDTWTSNPDRAFGRLIPDIMAAVTSAGSSSVASGGSKVAGALRKAAEAVKAKPPAKPSPLTLGKHFGRKEKEIPPLFRGDGRPTDEIFQDGMTARSPDMSLEEHLGGGNGLIGASKIKDVARGFAIQHRGYIYEIEDRGNSIRVKYPPGYGHLAGEREFVFTRIEPSQVRGAWKPGKLGKPDIWIPNPNFKPK